MADKEFVTNFTDKFAEVFMSQLSSGLEQLTSRVNELGDSLINMQVENQVLRREIDALKQAGKRKCLRLIGLPEERNEDLKDALVNMCSNYLQLPLEKDSIVHVYRAKGKQVSKINPVLVEFSTVQIRDQVLSKRKLLRNTKLILVEDLTKYRHDLLMMAKKKLGSRNVWTVGGHISLFYNNKKHRLQTPEDLEGLIAQQAGGTLTQ